jgi:hypothetical protein
MPTSIGVGTTNFREVSVSETVNRQGVDSLTVSLRGKATGLQAVFDLYRRGSTYPGYPNMFLDSKSFDERGPVADIILNYIGFIDVTTDNGLTDVEDSITDQSVTLTTDEDENVTFRYFCQSTTSRWIYRGASKPTSPKFRGVVPSEIPTNLLFQPNPPNYTGSIAGRYKPNGRLAQFTRTRIAPNVWAVVETWENFIEPKND